MDPLEVTSLDLSYYKQERLPDEVFEFKNLEELILLRGDSLDLKKTLSDLTEFPKLRKLDLTRSKIKQIPRNITKLDNLEELILRHNYIAEFPNAFFKMDNLKVLDLYHVSALRYDQLEKLDAMTNLEYLDLSFGSWEEIPEPIGYLPNLHTLILEGNILIDIPASFSELSNLKRLDLSNNVHLELDVVFPIISKLQLEYLGLRDCEFQKIDGGIGDLTSLTELDLSDNFLKTVPASLGNCTNLEILRLGNTTRLLNKISDLPSTLSALDRLRILDITWGDLDEIPDCVAGMTSLEELILPWNRITTWPSEPLPSTLKVINLNYNVIGSIPPWIGQLKELEELHLEADFWVPHDLKIENLPKEVYQLRKLRVLNLNEQYISKLDEGLGNLTELRRLELKNTFIKQLPRSFEKLNKLEYLNLRSSELRQLPAGIENFENLEYLDISLNRRMNMGIGVQQVEEIQSLKKLDISYQKVSDSQLESLKTALPDCEIINLQLRDTEEPGTIVNPGKLNRTPPDR